MAVAAVTLHPSLQAWSASGLQYILLEEPLAQHAPAAGSPAIAPGAPYGAQPTEPLAVNALREAAFTQDGGALSGNVPLTGSEDRPTAALDEQPAAGQRNAAPSSSAPSGSSGFAPSAAGTQKPRIPRAQLTFASVQGLAADPQYWDAPWAECFAKTAPAPIVWTYRDLGGDLLGVTKSLERGNLFRSIIGSLRLPRGSSAFWPCAVPQPSSEGPSEVQAAPAIFAAGLRRLSPRYLVVFGREALAATGLPEDSVSFFRHVLVEGKVVALFPSPEALLAKESQREAAISLLRAIFADFA